MNDNLHDQLVRLASGYWYTQTIYVAARPGIVSLLKDGPRTVHDLAQATGAHPRPLYRLLRALASIGIFAEKQGHFTLTPLSECLLDPAMQAMLTLSVSAQRMARSATLATA